MFTDTFVYYDIVRKMQICVCFYSFCIEMHSVFNWICLSLSLCSSEHEQMENEEWRSRFTYIYICIILSCKASEWEIYAFNAFLTQLKSIRSKITLCCQTFNKIIYSVVATDISYHTWRRLFRVNIVSWLSYLPLKANFLIFFQCLLNLLHSFGLPVANCSSKQRISELATHSFYNNYYSKMCV